MANLIDYYRDLLNWEGVAFQTLVDAWPTVLRQSIENDLCSSVSASGVKNSLCPIRPGSTNQSIGNQVEEYTINRLTPYTSQFRIQPCSGSGYPDKMLVDRNTSLRILLEVKATSDWNPNDSNRRVLTSSSQKLRQQFRSPIHHLLLTVLYTVQTGTAKIDAVRLDFLEPTTAVNVRLEASVSHKILASGPHHSKVI